MLSSRHVYRIKCPTYNDLTTHPFITDRLTSQYLHAVYNTTYPARLASTDGKTNGNGAAGGGSETPAPSSDLAQLRLGSDTSAERPHLTGKDWYFGPVSRSQADQLLANRGQDGCFLVRDSETNVSAREGKGM